MNERRVTAFRSGSGAGREIHGYAARFNVPTTIGGRDGFVETIRTGAFTRALKQRQDVRALVNHDASKIVGRTGNGTLRLTEDEKGLSFRCTVADTGTGDELLELLRTQTVSECSFGFSVPAGGDRWTRSLHLGEMRDCRELVDVDLFDVSAVTYPAYPSTSVDLVAAVTAATASRSIPSEVRSRIRNMIDASQAMSNEMRAIYTQGLLLEANADLSR